MIRFALYLKYLVEREAFALFVWLGNVLRLSSASTRLFFIYITFITAFSPFWIVYMAVSYLVDVAKHARQRRSMVWDM